MRSVTISEIKLHPVGLPLVEKLRTSYGAEPFKSAVIVAVTTSDGLTGWGECPTKTRPSYAYETVGTALHILSESLTPSLVGKTVERPTDVPKLLKAIFQNALLLATLATIVAGAILVAYADREAVDGRRIQSRALQADEGVPRHWVAAVGSRKGGGAMREADEGKPPGMAS